MKTRFDGVDGHRRLVECLRKQSIVAGDAEAAERLASVAIVEEFAPGTPLIRQDGVENDIFFILTGEVSISVHNRNVAQRSAGQHVGEMALIDPSAPRSATVVATSTTVVAKVSEPDLVIVAREFPHLWRSLALELCCRLRQRNVLVKSPNHRPKLFIGCASEALDFARDIQLGLNHDDIDVVVWTDDVFAASHFAVEDLEAQLESSDFGILILSADDEITSRGLTSPSPRDNVVFELGLFVGQLGHRRTFIVKPSIPHLKVPSDLLGLTPITYVVGKPSCAATVCTEIRKLVASLGVR
jgi:CRP/FNR family transcriptional regulator, cyclic AMP receptor protein